MINVEFTFLVLTFIASLILHIDLFHYHKFAVIFSISDTSADNAFIFTNDRCKGKQHEMLILDNVNRRNNLSQG